MKNIAKFCLFFSYIFGFATMYANEIYPFFLTREDGTSLEGYFSPPESPSSSIVFAIQGSSCERVLEWHKRLSDQMSLLAWE